MFEDHPIVKVTEIVRKNKVNLKYSIASKYFIVLYCIVQIHNTNCLILLFESPSPSASAKSDLF